MQKWEYSLVRFEQDRLNNWHPRFIHGKEVKNWEGGPDIPAFLSQVGDEGWELVQVLLDSKESAYRLFFKRQK